MATTLSSYPDAPVPQLATQVKSSHPVLPAKRPFSESYYSSYGESEGTPTPKPSKTPRFYSSHELSSGPSNSTFSSTPQLAQVLRESSMEESGDESDGVYDEFDLGDFTKEEIKAYESMVGPGERLRDAAPPERSLADILEASYQKTLASSSSPIKDSCPVSILPKELYELVRCGISNAVERAISEKVITEKELTKEALKQIFLDEISAPTPQILYLIRNYDFIWSSSISPKRHRRQALRDACTPSRSLKLTQKQSEQDVYDLSRNLGLPMERAGNWVLKAREHWGEKDYDSTDTEERDIAKGLDEVLDPNHGASSLQNIKLPLMSAEPFEPFEQAPGGVTLDDSVAHLSLVSGDVSAFSVSQASILAGGSTNKIKGKTKDTVHLVTETRLKDVEQLQERQSQELEVPDSCSDDDRNMPVGGEPVVDNVANEDRHKGGTEAVANHEEKKAAKKALKKAARKARSAQAKAEDKASMQVGKELEGEDNPRQPKKKGSKRKSKHEEVQSVEIQTPRKSRVDSDAQGVTFSKTKRKKRGPQQSPFFQRSNGSKRMKKDSSKKTEASMDFQPPMIQ